MSILVPRVFPSDSLTATPPFTVARLQAFVFRWPVTTPVQISFGTMHDRPAVFIRVETGEGAVGWGEAWCNFPGCGAEHRARLIETVVAPLLEGRQFSSPMAAFAELSERTAVLAIQSGEPGPLAQVIAGTDLALWDLVARRAGQPLWRLLSGVHDDAGGDVAVYASGINPDRPQDVVAARRAEGHRAFKLKIGFGEARDLQNLSTVRSMLADGEALMADANQAWPLDAALRIVPALEDSGLTWLEEPLRADRPAGEWKRLAEASGIPLAAGENLIGEPAFAAMIDSNALAVVQPDIAKWGGISGCLPVLERIRTAGLRYCPHYLGAGLGLLASAHLLAAHQCRGDTIDSRRGMLEIDANDNPLRTALCGPLNSVREGRVQLGDEPGLGVTPNLAELGRLCLVSA